MCVSLLGSVLLVGSCGKDPLFEQGDYIYENNDFTRVDNVNGFIIHWADDVEISEEQQAVILNLIANLVRVEGGTFMMGAQHSNPESTNYDPGAADNESPVHQVTLSDYYIAKYEVTQREWSAVMGDDLGWSDLYGKGDLTPAYNVSWEAANAFVERLGALTRLSFHLPSEAQWEYAARGGSYTQDYRFSGSDDVNDVAWYNGNAGGILHSVGEKQPNELGLYDMSGNVWEWCSDSYALYSEDDSQDPCVLSGSPYVLRGGSWTYLSSYCRVTCRDSYNSAAVSTSVGFRVSLRGSESY